MYVWNFFCRRYNATVSFRTDETPISASVSRTKGNAFLLHLWSYDHKFCRMPLTTEEKRRIHQLRMSITSENKTGVRTVRAAGAVNGLEAAAAVLPLQEVKSRFKPFDLHNQETIQAVIMA